ncbi:hypothetical protein [Marispirochaeta sp.]|uniref:hypothetical protein n=1 Tax=Marispirochaeta sp. TaxID=2038653 RepID=UPI0029C9A167|nr:hypothetical protein [Marispirochaeta sp.]
MLRDLKAFQVFFFPWGIKKIGFFPVELTGQSSVLLNNLQVDMHSKKGPVFCPVCGVIYRTSKGVERITEIGFQGSLQVPDVLFVVFRIAVQLGMK